MQRTGKSERYNNSVIKSYAKYSQASGRAVRFDPDSIREWMADYVRQGYTARSLGKRNTEARLWARRNKFKFPPLGSDDWLYVKDMEKALLRADVTDPKQADILDLSRIEKIMDAHGIESLDDLWTCPPWLCALITRALVVNAAMMRACAHDRVLLKKDVSKGDGSGYIGLNIGELRSARKIKLRPARTAMLHIDGHRTSPGAAMLIYMRRFHHTSDAGAALFCEFKGGIPQHGVHRRADDFIHRVKQQLRRAGEHDDVVSAITGHSLRSGGCTDWCAAGMSAEFIKQQGGWASDAWMMYNRPRIHHHWSTAAAMLSRVATRRTELAAYGRRLRAQRYVRQ